MDSKVDTRASFMKFGMYTSQEVKNMSVKQITSSKSLDGDAIVESGPYDTALGPVLRGSKCSTCGESAKCDGHFGHIKLPKTMYNPYMFSTMIKLMNQCCLCCGRIRINRIQKAAIKLQMKAICNGNVNLSYKIDLMWKHLIETLGDREAVEDNNTTDKMEKEKEPTKIKMNDIQSGSVNEIIKELKSIYYKEAANDSSSVKDNRGIMMLKNEIVNNFISGFYTTKLMCTYCHVKHRVAKGEYNVSVYLSKGLNPSQVKTFLQTRKELEKINDNDDESMLDEDESFEDELKMDKVDWETRNFNVDSLTFYNSDSFINSLKSHHRIVTPEECKKFLTLVFGREKNFLKHVFSILNYEKYSGRQDNLVDKFFFDNVLVTPNIFRPMSISRNMKIASPQTLLYEKIIENGNKIKNYTFQMENGDETVDVAETKKMYEKSMSKLQTCLNTIFDSNMDKFKNKNDPVMGLRQIVEKKEGLFRSNIMGKRVDFAARSVISPDPYLLTREVGMPVAFAKILTFPESINEFNVEKMQKLVISGPNNYPGARYVEYKSGLKRFLHPYNEKRREDVAEKMKSRLVKDPIIIVHRHMVDGDLVLLNRQPTLHRASMQAHVTKILPGEKTMRLHYSACKAYNADFDGDEMNAHYPQTEQARVELLNLALTDHQYLSPKNGAPLAGLIQDHIVSGVLFTVRGRFFDKRKFFSLIYSSMSHFIDSKTLKYKGPSIIKPREMWSGKDVISTILCNLIAYDGKGTNFNFSARSKVTSLILQENLNKCGIYMSESQVVFREGCFLVGILDKNHYGATAYGLTHAIYELYGPKVAANFLSCLSKLFTYFLQNRGFTFNVQDILLTKKANRARRKIIRKLSLRGTNAVKRFIQTEDQVDEKTLKHYINDAIFETSAIKMAKLDYCFKMETDAIQNEICQVTMPQGLLKQFPQNNLQLMVNSGAKGSIVNCQQISSTLGQIDLEGQRPRRMISGKSLPSFLLQDVHPNTCGFVSGRFLTGISPQDFYFHSMAGREGLIDTACKTSRSGYLQRCLIKHLESIYVAYDRTVRDGDGSIIQFKYGEDGLHVERASYLKMTQSDFILDNVDILQSKTESESNMIKSLMSQDKSKDLWRQLNRSKLLKKSSGFAGYTSAFDQFCTHHYSLMETKDDKLQVIKKIKSMWVKYLKNVKRGKIDKGEKFQEFCVLDPPNSILNVDESIGAVSEKLHGFITMCLNSNDLLSSKAKRRIKRMMYVKCYRALVEPGDSVGILAAQSVGEPSTQMTLNTFHFAGKGEMNVTLGIPRLTEILMRASEKIKTPYMEAILLPGKHVLHQAKKLSKILNQVKLHQVLSRVDIEEKFEFSTFKAPSRNYIVTFCLCDSKFYKDTFLTPEKVIGFIEQKFLAIVINSFNKRIAELNKHSLVSTNTSKKQSAGDSADVEQNDEPVINEVELSNDESTMEDDYSHDDLSDRESIQLDDEEEEEADFNELVDSDVDIMRFNPDTKKIKIENIKTPTDTQYDDVKPPLNSKFENKQAIVQRHKFIKNFHFDQDNFSFCKCEFTFPLKKGKLDFKVFIQKLALETMIHSVPGITRCIVSKNPKSSVRIKMESNVPQAISTMTVEGVNLKELYKYSDIIDLNYLYSNDIHAIARAYGIEAAYSIAIQEINSVFSGYGIDVDRRHLSLIVDYMTHDGYFQALSRNGINTNSSPLQKMSFETTLNFMKDSILSGATDNISSPSARLTLGRVPLAGTGLFELKQKTKKL